MLDAVSTVGNVGGEAESEGEEGEDDEWGELHLVRSGCVIGRQVGYSTRKGPQLKECGVVWVEEGVQGSPSGGEKRGVGRHGFRVRLVRG